MPGPRSTRQSAQRRNQEVREQQKRISEERRRRSLRSEDFSSWKDTPEPAKDNFRFQEDASAPTAPSKETIKSSEKRPDNRAVEWVRSMFRPVGTRHEGEFSVMASIVLLCLLGLVMITSSSYYYAYNNIGDPLYFLKRQLFNLGIGGFFLLATMFIPLNFFKKLSLLAYIGATLSAVAVLFFGVSEKGSLRWLAIGPIQFQPAELVKLGLAVFMAAQVEARQKTITTLRTFMILLAFVMIPTALVAYQNLSSGIIIAMIGLTIMLVGGCKLRYFVVLGVIAAAFLGVFVVMPVFVPLSKFPVFLQGFLERFMYRANRVKAFLDPFRYSQKEGYQIVQSLYAIGSGGLFGQGLGESIQKLGFIPEAYNDIIFAIICEELGLIGAGLVIVLFGILIYSSSRIARNAPDRFTRYLSAGLMMQVGLQAALNIAVSTNSLPATGISLPFISYGGSSVAFLMASMGLILNVSRFTRPEQ